MSDLLVAEYARQRYVIRKRVRKMSNVQIKAKAPIKLMKTREISQPWKAVAADFMEFPRSVDGFEFL